jgi:hypothetical protein
MSIAEECPTLGAAFPNVAVQRFMPDPRSSLAFWPYIRTRRAFDRVEVPEGKGLIPNVLWKRPLTLRKDAGCDDPSTAKDNQFVPDHLGVAGQLIPPVASCVSGL